MERFPARAGSERSLGPGIEAEGMIEEREVERFRVGGFDHDRPWTRQAADAEAVRLDRKRQIVHLVREPATNDLIVEARCEARRGAHLFLELIVPDVDFADVDAVVERRHEERERDQASEPAFTVARANHHWDCAPSTMLTVRRSSASSLPSCSVSLSGS